MGRFDNARVVEMHRALLKAFPDATDSVANDILEALAINVEFSYVQSSGFPGPAWEFFNSFGRGVDHRVGEEVPIPRIEGPNDLHGVGMKKSFDLGASEDESEHDFITKRLYNDLAIEASRAGELWSSVREALCETAGDVSLRARTLVNALYNRYTLDPASFQSRSTPANYVRSLTEGSDHTSETLFMLAASLAEERSMDSTGLEPRLSPLDDHFVSGFSAGHSENTLTGGILWPPRNLQDLEGAAYEVGFHLASSVPDYDQARFVFVSTAKSAVAIGTYWRGLKIARHVDHLHDAFRSQLVADVLHHITKDHPDIGFKPGAYEAIARREVQTV